ncbi:MAG: MBL fold metallo-hydrolase [Pseudomonadales bacterium]|nr:MBL fold metallo-hydrolase [Pseudomonadales bacterium]
MKNNLILKQLFDTRSSTYTYLLADSTTRQAVIIDCVYEQHERDLSLIQELGLVLVACLDTHCHADHVTGAWLMKHAISSKTMASARSGIASLDEELTEGDKVKFGERVLTVRETPGHTDGCLSFLLDDESMVFTGDSLLIRGCGRTDFQQGSAKDLFSSIKNTLFDLPEECIVYPGHDYEGRTSSSIGEEIKYNPRIGGRANEQDFVGYLENMVLAHPKQIDIAVPANLKAGKPEADKIPVKIDWAPVITTFSHTLQVSPQWVAGHLDTLHILDVRTAREFSDEMTPIKGAQNIPLDELRDRIDDVPRGKPVMIVCRSGRRSVLAFNILRKAGLVEVADIGGGLLRWEDEGLS